MALKLPLIRKLAILESSLFNDLSRDFFSDGSDENFKIVLQFFEFSTNPIDSEGEDIGRYSDYFAKVGGEESARMQKTAILAQADILMAPIGVLTSEAESYRITITTQRPSMFTAHRQHPRNSGGASGSTAYFPRGAK